MNRIDPSPAPAIRNFRLASNAAERRAMIEEALAVVGLDDSVPIPDPDLRWERL